MANPVVANACGCEKFGFGETNFGTKHMSDLMRTQADWAKAILDADRLPVANWNVLNPANSRGNTYGALVLGLNVPQRGWEAADATVKKTLTEWIKNLNTVFGAHQKYEPKQLKEWAGELRQVADCLGKQSATLAQRAEITTNDNAYFTQIVQALNSLAANLDKLHEAVAKGPDICEVILDWQPAKH